MAGQAPRTRRARAAAGLPVEDHEPSTSPTTSTHPIASTSQLDVLMDEDGDAEPPAKRRRSTWRRAQILLPGQADVPPVVETVDDQTSFSMFDGGWILPEGQKRRNRVGAPVPGGRKAGRSGACSFYVVVGDSADNRES